MALARTIIRQVLDNLLTKMIVVQKQDWFESSKAWQYMKSSSIS
jgi:hypothetical protein